MESRRANDDYNLIGKETEKRVETIYRPVSTFHIRKFSSALRLAESDRKSVQFPKIDALKISKQRRERERKKRPIRGEVWPCRPCRLVTGQSPGKYGL